LKGFIQRRMLSELGLETLCILIADSQVAVRQYLAAIISECLPFIDVCEAATGGQAVARMATDAVDIALLDIHLPAEGGVRVLRQLKAVSNLVPVIMLDGIGDSYYVEASRQAGATGYLSKYVAPDQLITAIQTVLGGGVFLPAGSDLEQGQVELTECLKWVAATH
jgi:DNA-binding NarL/FixJ family response regulator